MKPIEELVKKIWVITAKCGDTFASADSEKALYEYETTTTKQPEKVGEKMKPKPIGFSMVFVGYAMLPIFVGMLLFLENMTAPKIVGLSAVTLIIYGLVLAAARGEG